MRKNTPLALILLLSGCTLLPDPNHNSAAPLPDDAPLSGYYLIKNRSIYDGIAETSRPYQYSADISKMGGDVRAEAIAKNFCAEQGMQYNQQLKVQGTMTFNCFNKQQKKRPLVPIPVGWSPSTARLSTSWIRDSIRRYAKDNKINILSSDNTEVYGWKRGKTSVSLPSYMRVIDTIGFSLNLDARIEITYLLSCKDHRASKVGLTKFNSLFAEYGKFEKNHDNRPKEILPNTMLNSIWSSVCRKRPSSVGDADESEMIVNLKRNSH